MNRTTKIPPITSCLMALIILVSLSGNVFAEATTDAEGYVIVSLGDSISAGYEPGMTAGSIPYGFVDRLKEQALFHGRTQVKNCGILGLTSDGLKNYVAAILTGKAVTPDKIQQKVKDPRIAKFASGVSKAKEALEQADLITITIGGNDLLKLLPNLNSLNSVKELKESAFDVLKNYDDNVHEVITILTKINPKAQIVLVDQYQPIPKIAGTAAVYAELQKVADAFTKSVDDIASDFVSQSKQVKAAHIAKVFAGREIALTHIFSEWDIHPNQAGYEEIAKVIAKVVWGSYRETAAKAGDAPVSVVVKGQELKTSYPPILKNNQTFVAIKDITDAIGAESRWNSKASTSTITYRGHTVVIPVGSGKITVDGVISSTATPAFLSKAGKEVKAYVPLAVLVQGLKLDVQYSGKMKTVFINEA